MPTTPPMEPAEVVREGGLLLAPVLAPFGFTFHAGAKESARLAAVPYELGVAGPAYARGEFRKENRRLEFEYSWSLGPVTYWVGDAFLEHVDYLSSLGVRPGTSRYPGFSDDPLQSFRDLAYDLTTSCAEFLSGTLTVFPAAAEAAAFQRAAKQRRDMAGYVGDDTIRAQARDAFQAGDYASVITLLESLAYAEFMDRADAQRLEIARRRVSR